MTVAAIVVILTVIAVLKLGDWLEGRAYRRINPAPPHRKLTQAERKLAEEHGDHAWAKFEASKLWAIR